MLKLVQSSGLGVNMGGGLVLSGVGQADDTGIISNDLTKLLLILKLVKDYCIKYNVQLSSSKTKLMEITPPRVKTKPTYNPINIDGEPIGFVKQAEHVGVLRSTDGNMPNILQRVTAFKNALGSIVSCGLAHGRTSNPSASFRILACPVLCYQARKLPALTSSSRGNFRALSSCLPIPLPHWSTL